MHHILGLRCLICGKLYQPDEVTYVCPDHGDDGTLDVEYDYAQIRSQLAANPPDWARQGMFAYRPLLPVAETTAAPPLHIGATPVYDAPRLAATAGVAQVWVKDDGRNPTASFKDRASAIAVMKAAERGAEIITTASTGNAAAALAGIAAATGQKTVIFVPASAPQAKIAQLLTYGATVLLVEGSYDDAFELCLKATHAFGWYCRNTGYNPYMSEGKKTVTFELYQQLGLEMSPISNLQSPISNFPTHIFVSVGDGCIIGGVYKGLRDLVGLGLLPQMPKLMGVQAAGSSYLYEAWRNDEDVVTKAPIAANTRADSISAGLPRDRIKAMRAIRETDGAFVQVSDAAILAAIPKLAQHSGVFAEPAAAAAYAGLLQAAADGQVGPSDRVALLITGSGLKDVAAAITAVSQATTIKPTLAAVEQALNL
ncbi:MAG: threonine synthase [Ardenticatenaceae bacterium]|nr:threonine synthase [Ardenticatenaceae bacterium]